MKFASKIHSERVRRWNLNHGWFHWWFFWNGWETFFRSYCTLINFIKPIWMITAIFGILQNSTGMWWSVKTTSILSNIFLTHKCGIESCRKGVEYRLTSASVNLHEGEILRETYLRPLMQDCLHPIVVQVQTLKLPLQIHSGACFWDKKNSGGHRS